MWVRDFRSPPRSLALFQVYQRFAPVTAFQGMIWRLQVEQDVCLQCYLMPGPRRGSFLDVRRGPRKPIIPPILHVEGQMEAALGAELPITEWLSQGTRWWLRNLGSVLVDPGLRLELLHSLLELDGPCCPNLLEAVAYHPIVPLADGSWISLQKLRQYSTVYLARTSAGVTMPGWLRDFPVVQKWGILERLNQFLDRPMQDAEEQIRDRVYEQWREEKLARPAWKAQTTERPLPPPSWTHQCPAGRALFRLAKRRNGRGSWTVNYENESIWTSDLRLLPHWPLSLSIELNLQERPPHSGSDLRKGWKKDLYKSLLESVAEPLRLLLSQPDWLSEFCCLVGVALEAGLDLPEWIWDYNLRDGTQLSQVLATDLKRFSAQHPVHRLAQLWGSRGSQSARAGSKSPENLDTRHHR